MALVPGTSVSIIPYVKELFCQNLSSICSLTFVGFAFSTEKFRNKLYEERIREKSSQIYLEVPS